VNIVEFTWGTFSYEVIENIPTPDYIFGADLLYDEDDFDGVLASVAFFFEVNPYACFYTTYQERSDSYRIDKT
jgi:hypothetical protein